MKKTIFISTILIFMGTLFAAVIYVPDDYSTINDAINAANIDDEIIVRDGTYLINGNQLISVSGLTLRSENGASSCVIDFNQNPSSFIINASSVIIDGLAFKNSTG